MEPYIGSRHLISGIDFTESAPRVARRLIGSTLLVEGVGGVIVETEAYDQAEEACHAFGGITLRTASLFGPPGHAYVYLSYGIHWCLNFVCREEGHAAGVLIRALEPTVGIPTMKLRRQQSELTTLCAGPGRLCQALAVTGSLNGKRIDRPPFRILPSAVPVRIVSGTRIGVSKAALKVWRYGLKGSPYHSRPFRRTHAEEHR